MMRVLGRFLSSSSRISTVYSWSRTLTTETQRTVPFGQELTLLCISWVTSSLSIAGSSCIFFLLYRRRQKRTSSSSSSSSSSPLNPLGRLLIGMSACDVLHSSVLLLQGILLPAATSPRAFARGNDATCSMLGFFVQFSFSVAFYNGMVSYYYLLTIRHGLSEAQVAHKYELFMHGLSLSFPLITAIVGVALSAFNETFAGPGCWVDDFPKGCQDDPELDCQSFLFGYLIAGGPIMVIFLCIVANMVRIYLHVRRILRRGARRSFDSTTQTTRIDQVATQAYLYVAVFCLTFVFGFLTQSLEAASGPDWDEASIFPWLVLHQIFWPLQGFFNFFIFIRPKYLLVRSSCLEESRWWAFREALRREMNYGVSGTNRRRARRITMDFEGDDFVAGYMQASPQIMTLSSPKISSEPSSSRSGPSSGSNNNNNNANGPSNSSDIHQASASAASVSPNDLFLDAGAGQSSTVVESESEV